MISRKVLFIGLVWPEPTSSAAGWRILQLIELFQEMKFEIHFASTAQKSAYSEDLVSKGISENFIELNDSSFDNFIKNLNPEIVVFDRFMIEEQFGWRVKENCPNTIRILDTEDLHFLRNAREQAQKKNLDENIFLFSDQTKREIASIYRSDLSLIISEYEMNLLIKKFNIPKEIIHYIPFLEKISTFENLKSFKEREHICFIGNFIHEPNYQTVLQLKKIWTDLSKKLANVELHIYGAYASQKVEQLHQPKERFFIKGRAENARNTIENYRILLAPIPFGAGLKGKFIDAMQAGTPSITNKIGSEGISSSLWNGFLVDNQNDLIIKTCELYQNENLWKEKQTIGFEILESKFDFETFYQEFNTKLELLTKNITEHKQLNFVGEILWFENNMATKYLSKWIEEKNKKS